MYIRGLDGCIYCDPTNNAGLMVCCDRCQIWYHFKCINKKWDLDINRRQLRHLSHYYCYPCRRANPFLKLKYYSSDNFNRVTLNLNEDDKRIALDLNNQLMPAHKPTSPSSTSSDTDSNMSSSSSSTQSDEAVENKQPDEPTKCNSLNTASPICPGRANTQQQQQSHNHSHPNSHQQQSQPQSHNSSHESTSKTSGNKRKRAFKSGRAKLRSKLEKAMRRQRHPSSTYL